MTSNYGGVALKTVLQGGTKESKVAALNSHMARLNVLKQRILSGNGGPGNKVRTVQGQRQGRVRRRRVYRQQPRQQLMGRRFVAQRFPQRFPQRRIIVRRTV